MKYACLHNLGCMSQSCSEEASFSLLAITSLWMKYTARASPYACVPDPVLTLLFFLCTSAFHSHRQVCCCCCCFFLFFFLFFSSLYGAQFVPKQFMDGDAKRKIKYSCWRCLWYVCVRLNEALWRARKVLR